MSSLASSVSSASESTDSTGIVRNSNFDLGNIQFGAPKVNASGGKNVPLYNASAKKGLTLQTPLMLAWGVNEWTDDNSGRKTYDMSLQFPTAEYANTNTSQFLENMMALEDHIKETAVFQPATADGKLNALIIPIFPIGFHVSNIRCFRVLLRSLLSQANI